jgi:hypothetical protein
MEDTCKQCGKWPTDKPVLVDGGILCVDCASNLLRWRKWPEEKPTDEANFLVVDKHGLFSVKYWCEDDARLWIELLENGSYWRPIGPLPGGE